MSDISKVEADFASHHIEGIARMGNTPFRCPLVTHVIDNLWQGGCRDGVELPHDFRHVLSLYPWEQFKLGPDTKRLEVPLYDGDEIEDGLDEIVEAGVRMVEDGKTLIHCQAGLNRSGMVAALVLMRWRGLTPSAAVGLLRTTRTPAVLCNPAFERHVLGTV